LVVKGLSFKADGLCAFLEINSPLSQEQVALLHREPVVETFVAPLVANARPSIRRDKPYADAAAKLIREGTAARRSDAIRAVAYNDPHRTTDSIFSGIRRCFDLHYSPKGKLLSEIDQN
jgi:hypothetical protein